MTIVGEGEPTLYLGLGEIIHKIKLLTKKPVAIITNGSLLYDPDLQLELESADIILPSLDAYDEASFKKINRPHGKLHFEEIYQGLKDFSLKYSRPLETMKHAAEILGGTSIDLLVSSGFHSEISDNYEAILSIINRHPMNQFEIEGFLSSRGCNNKDFIFLKLGQSGAVERMNYKGYMTFRMK